MVYGTCQPRMIPNRQSAYMCAASQSYVTPIPSPHAHRLASRRLPSHFAGTSLATHVAPSAASMHASRQVRDSRTEGQGWWVSRVAVAAYSTTLASAQPVTPVGVCTRELVTMCYPHIAHSRGLLKETWHDAGSTSLMLLKALHVPVCYMCRYVHPFVQLRTTLNWPAAC
jgi:hypothetical protein